MCVLKRKNSGHRIQQIYLHVWQRFYIAVVLGSETIGNLEWNYLKVRIIIIFFQANYKHSVSPAKLLNGSIVMLSSCFKEYTCKIPILYLNAQILKYGIAYESPGPYIFTSFSRRGFLPPSCRKNGAELFRISEDAIKPLCLTRKRCILSKSWVYFLEWVRSLPKSTLNSWWFLVVEDNFQKGSICRVQLYCY